MRDFKHFCWDDEVILSSKIKFRNLTKIARCKRGKQANQNAISDINARENAQPAVSAGLACCRQLDLVYISSPQFQCRLWLAKCCKIQQLIYFHSTKIFIQLQQKYLFTFNKNNFIQQKYLFNFNKIISFNKNIYSTSTKIFIQL